MWLQSAQYPRCPRCSRAMRFLAQIENRSIGMEGLRYAFFCGKCRVSATTCQQT